MSNERDGVLRRLDLAARGALLAAGLLAQWAMWLVAPSWVYPVAAVALVALSVESARRPFVIRAGAHARVRRRNACRVVACVVLAELCVGVVGSVPFSGAVPMAVPVGVLLLTVQCAQVQAVASRRDAMAGLLVVVAMLADAGFCARDARPAVAVVPAVVMLLIGAALLQRGSVLARTRSAIGLPSTPVLRALFVPVTSAIVIGAITFLALPNSLQLGTRNTMARVAAAGDEATAGRSALDPGASTLDLRARGTLSDQPVFAVAANSPAYWQGSVFDTFNGTSWTTTGAAPDPVVAQPVRTDTVRVLSADGLDVVVAPGAPTAYSGPGVMVPAADGTAALTSASASPPWSYQVSSTSPPSEPTTLRAVTGADPADPIWKAVEPGLTTRVRELAAQLTAAAPTRYDAVSAVDSYLRTHERYDLNSPLPAPGHDAVDDFLFVSHRGFCEQFASAAVIMLRSTGIPARLVTGYSQGDVASVAGERVMRGTDAHAWIQVWYPGVGWVSSDPTAAAVASAQVATVTVAKPDRHPLPLAAAVRLMPGARLGWLVALVALACFVALVERVVRHRRPTAPRPLVVPQPGDGPVLQAYVRLDAALGGQAREPAQTLREAARHLHAAGCSGAELAAALDCLERECYSIAPPTPVEQAVAVDVFDRLRIASSSSALTP